MKIPEKCHLFGTYGIMQIADNMLQPLDSMIINGIGKEFGSSKGLENSIIGT
jgi:hypothetical protein